MKNLDFVSPGINLNFEGYNNHASNFGISLTIIISILGLSFASYVCIELWERKKPSSNVIYKYTADAGTYKVGVNGLNHCLILYDNKFNQLEFDERATKLEAVWGNIEKKPFGYYLYSKCKWDIDGRDFYNMKDDINKEKFEKGACIRYFKNATTNETIELTKDNISTFPFANLSYGVDSSVKMAFRTMYTLKLKECTNSTENSNCYSKEKINQIHYNYIANLIFVDKIFDITNYKNPIQSQFNQILGKLTEFTFTSNYLNFNPSTIKSDNGIIFEQIKVDKSIYLYLNEKLPEEKKDNSTLAQYIFILKNQETIYIRSYIKCQDIFAKIGGFVNFIYYFSLAINYFPNKYIVLIESSIILHQNNYKSENNLENKIKSSNFKDTSYFKLKKTEVIKIQQNKDLGYSKSNMRIISNSNDNNFENLVKKQIQEDRLNENLRHQHHIIKYNFWNMIFFAFSKNPIHDKITKIRNLILSESNLFKLYFNEKKIKKIIFSENERKLLDDISIYEEIN